VASIRTAATRRDEAEPAVGQVLAARGVVRSFGAGNARTRVLHDVDLDIERGEWIAVMGPSGCGKSTLLHILGGLDRPDAGAVWLGGTRIDDLSETRRAVLRRTRLGVVFQFFNLVPQLTAAGNVESPMRLAGVSRSDARRRVEALLGAVGLSERARSYPAQLSGGEQQRVSIARALANDPLILLADEPTGALDSESAQQVLDLLRRAHGRGQTIVMVTHDPHIGGAADRLVRMRDGRIVGEERTSAAAGRTGDATAPPA
jgi:putative ABC transport system ATP-binding protein